MSKQVNRTFPVMDMHSSNCARRVKLAIMELPGVAHVDVNLTSSSVLVKYDSAQVTSGEIRAAALSAGYDLIVDDENQVAFLEKEFLRKSRRLRKQVIGTWVFAIPMLLLSVQTLNIPYSNFIRMGIALVVMLMYGRVFFLHTWELARKKIFTMDALVVLSTTVAFLFSAFNTIFPEFWLAKGLQPHTYYEATVVIIAFVLTGKMMTAKSTGNSTIAIRNLMGLRPKIAYVQRGESEVEIPIKEIQVGDLVVIHSGEKISIDGVVVEGNSFVDESMITGESLPVEKEVGSKITAGTTNQHKTIVVEAQKVGEDTFLAQIIRMVQEAQAVKTPAVKIVDKVSSFMLPFFLVLATLSLILWLTVAHTEPRLWFGVYSFISILILACPCTIGFAAPAALIIGVAKAEYNDTIIKDAKALEQLRLVDTVVLDKTGTITEGSTTVIGWLWAVPQKDIYKQIILAAEERAEHPLSSAVVEELSIKSKLEPIQLDSFKSRIGGGIEVSYQGESYWVGGKRLKNENNVVIEGPLVEMLVQYEEKGNGIVYFGRGKELLAIIAVADQIKPTSYGAIRELRRMGLSVVMLTGDSDRAAKAVAKRLDIHSYKAEVFPNEKEEFIRHLQSTGKKVAMVGDGVNDSQALACADVSIAMGKGTDVAMNVAMITLMTSDLLVLPKIIKLSKRTVLNIRQNLFWAFIFNILALPIAAGIFAYKSNIAGQDAGMLSPLVVNVVMILSSLAVVVNSIFLENRKLK